MDTNAFNVHACLQGDCKILCTLKLRMFTEIVGLEIIGHITAWAFSVSF